MNTSKHFTCDHETDVHSFLLTITEPRFRNLDAKIECRRDHSIATDKHYRFRLSQECLNIVQRLVDANFDFHSHEKLNGHHKKLKMNWEVWVAHSK